MKVSFITRCMNRLEHIKETYLFNIDIAIQSGLDFEFVLLDWSSTDGLQEWIKLNLSSYIKKDIVKVITVKDQNIFHRSKTLNILGKSCDGELICNLDADNYLCAGFLSYIKDTFNQNSNSIIHCRGKVKQGWRGIFGRMVYRKDNFLKIRGYDESMSGYGEEDMDFLNRYCHYFKPHFVILREGECGKCIHHGINEQMKMSKNKSRSDNNIKNGNLIVNPEIWGEV